MYGTLSIPLFKAALFSQISAFYLLRCILVQIPHLLKVLIIHSRKVKLPHIHKVDRKNEKLLAHLLAPGAHQLQF